MNRSETHISETGLHDKQAPSGDLAADFTAWTPTAPRLLSSPSAGPKFRLGQPSRSNAAHHPNTGLPPNSTAYAHGHTTGARAADASRSLLVGPLTQGGGDRTRAIVWPQDRRSARVPLRNGSGHQITINRLMTCMAARSAKEASIQGIFQYNFSFIGFTPYDERESLYYRLYAYISLYDNTPCLYTENPLIQEGRLLPAMDIMRLENIRSLFDFNESDWSIFSLEEEIAHTLSKWADLRSIIAQEEGGEIRLKNFELMRKIGCHLCIRLADGIFHESSTPQITQLMTLLGYFTLRADQRNGKFPYDATGSAATGETIQKEYASWKEKYDGHLAYLGYGKEFSVLIPAFMLSRINHFMHELNLSSRLFFEPPTSSNFQQLGMEHKDPSVSHEEDMQLRINQSMTVLDSAPVDSSPAMAKFEDLPIGAMIEDWLEDMNHELST